MDYLLLLFNQFNNSRGYKDISLNSKQYLEEFIFWLDNLKKQSSRYLDFILYNGIDLTGNNIIELNKGKYDTLPGEKLIVSPFASTLGEENANLVMYQRELLIDYGSRVIQGQVGDTYCTHNPYDKSYFGNLDILHNNGYNVCFGIFGDKNDKDKSLKIRFIRDTMRNMVRDYELEYDTSDDSYYYAVFTTHEIKRKVNSKSLIR